MAKLLDAYKDRIGAMIKKVLSSGAGDLIKVIHEMRDDIIKIINGGHIDLELDDEEMENGIKEFWEKILAYLRAHGKFGKIMAKLLDAYKDRIGAMIKKVLSSGAADLIKVIHEIRDDIIKIINGGHIDFGLDDEEIENGMKELWEKFIAYLK